MCKLVIHFPMEHEKFLSSNTHEFMTSLYLICDRRNDMAYIGYMQECAVIKVKFRDNVQAKLNVEVMQTDKILLRIMETVIGQAKT